MLDSGAEGPGFKSQLHVGCLQLISVWTADLSVDGRRSAASRTAISGGGAYCLPAPRAITCFTWYSREGHDCWLSLIGKDVCRVDQWCSVNLDVNIDINIGVDDQRPQHVPQQGSS